MKTHDLQLLPRVSDGLTFLYVERVRVEQDASAILLVDEKVRVPVPIACLSVLMLGPGTSATHAAMTSCSQAGCSVVFCGEAGVRLYACGLGDTRSSANLMQQAKLWADPDAHLGVVKKMYLARFQEKPASHLTLEQVRGMEGVRVRDAYAKAAKETGVAWSGRNYSSDWSASTPVNRALSTANACLYGLCHAAIVSTGFSPALGFVHTGKALSFVYDVADLYKCEVTVPISFRSAAGPLEGLEGKVRRACRDAFRASKLIERIVPDIQRLMGLREDKVAYVDTSGEIQDEPKPALWDPSGDIEGGKDYGDPDREHVLHHDDS
jgi:CRISPR-associated protein Cas1